MSSGPWPDGPGIVTFPDGTRVRGRALRAGPPRHPEPDVGVYLLGRPPPTVPWECRWIPWPDLRLPSDRDAACDQLVALARSAREQRVEVACRGGRGRTGTALAVMALACGVEPSEAVAWVRTTYDRRAVETPWQRRWVGSLDVT